MLDQLQGTAERLGKRRGRVTGSVAQGRTCEETLSALRRECESVIGGGK